MGEATLFFRCVVLPYSDYPDGPPEHFYNFVARTYSPQLIDINDTLTTTTETSIGDENVPQTNSAYIIEKRSSSEIFSHQPSEQLASFLKPVEMKTRRKQTDSESSTTSEPVQPAPKPKEETDQSPESKSTSSKKKKTDDSKAEDDGTKKKKKKSRGSSELKDDDGDPEKKSKKRKRKNSKLPEIKTIEPESTTETKEDIEKDVKEKNVGEPESTAETKEDIEKDIKEKNMDEPESTTETKEDIEKDVKEKNMDEPDSPKKSQKEEQTLNSKNNEQATELEKEDQKSKSENEGQNTNVERVPKFTQQPTPIKSTKQRKNSANLSSLNSFFGEKKIRKKSSNVSSSDNPLSTDDSNSSLKPIHSYNNLHLNKYYDDFKPLYNKHQKAIMDLAINQCTPIFIKAVMECLVAPPNVLQDFSDRLLEPINSYSILQFPALTSSDLLDLISPVYKGITIAINRPHQLDEWFSILATTLNFGLKLSSTASLYTSAHIECQ